MLKVLKVEADIDGVAVPFVDVVYIFFASQSSYKRSLWKHSSICRRPWFSCEWLVPFYSGQRRSCRRWLPALLCWRNPREPWLRKIEVGGGLQSKYCHWFLFHLSKKSAAAYYSYMSKVLRSSPLEAKKPKNPHPSCRGRLSDAFARCLAEAESAALVESGAWDWARNCKVVVRELHCCLCCPF